MVSISSKLPELRALQLFSIFYCLLLWQALIWIFLHQLYCWSAYKKRLGIHLLPILQSVINMFLVEF